MHTLLILAVVAGCLCDKFTWVGTTNQLWREPSNWSPFGIPTSIDDVVIPTGTVLIGNWHGAAAASLTLSGSASLSVQGSDLAVGTGGLTVQGSALLHIAAGNDTISVDGTISTTSTRPVQYATGKVAGSWKIGAGAGLAFVEATSASFSSISSYGTITANLPRLNLLIDSLTIAAGGVATFGNAQVMINTLVNDGTVNFVSESVTIQSSSGSGQTISTGSTLFGAYNNLIIPDSSSWISGTVAVLNIATGQTLPARDLKAFFAKGGIIKVFGELTIGNTVALEGIEFDGGFGPSGTINVQSGTTGKVGWIHFNFPGTQYIAVGGSPAFQVDDVQQEQGELHVVGGVLVASNVNASSTALVIESNGELQVTSKITVSTNVAIDGTLTIAKGAQLTSAPSAHFAPRANSTGARRINNNGVLNIQNGLTPATIQNLAYGGTGSILVFGQVDLENINMNVALLALKAITSRITGEGLTLAYGSLVTPQAGQNVSFFADGQLTSCKSPCVQTTSKTYQSVSIWISA